MDHVIRNASIDDADAIGAVVVRAWQAAYRGIMPDDYLDGLRAEQRAAMWQRVLADLGPDRWVRVLTIGDELVGFASCGPELAEFAAATDAGTPDAMWRSLEPAHILSQPWPGPHVAAHWRMLRLALRGRDRREALGQLVRLAVAAPGSFTGRYPEGNTGRASVGLREPMPIPPDLAAVLAGSRLG